MRLRRLFLLIVLILPSICWGQNTFITEKLVQAEEIKESKGICPEYIDVLFEAQDIATREGDNTALIKICEDILNALQTVFPKEKDLIQSSRLILALTCSEVGEHEKALPYLQDCLKIVKGTDYETERVLLGDIVTAYYSLGKVNNAIDYQKQLNALTLKNEGKGYKYASGLFWISTLYLELSDTKNAERVLKEALGILESANLTTDRLYFDTKYRYEILTTGSSSVESETAVFRKSHEYVQKFEDSNNPEFIEEALRYLEDKNYVHDIDTIRYHVLTTLAHYYSEKEDYQKTIETVLRKPYWESSDYFLTAYCEEAEGSFELAREGYMQAFAHAYLEKNDISDRFFFYFDSYARNCIQTGHYQEAFGLLEQFYAQESTIEGYESRAAQYMSMLAQLKYSINDYRGTIECVNKCAPLFLKIGAIDDYINNMSLVAACYEQLGDYGACAQEMGSLLTVLKTYPQYRDYVAGIEVAAALYSAQAGMTESAKESVEKTIQRFSGRSFTNFWMESVYHNSLGHYYQFYGDNVNAEKEFLIGANILKENAIESDSNYPQQLAALGLLYLQWPNNEHKALPIFEEAFNLIKKYHDPSYAQYFGYYEGVLAGKYASNTPTSLAEISDFVEVEKVQAQNLLFQMSEAERESFWKSHSDVKNLVFSFKETQSAPSFLYDYALLYKGLLLSSSMQIGSIVMNANDAELNALYGRYLVLSQEQKAENKSQETIDALEHQLLSRCQSLGYSINNTYSYSDVIATIGDNAAAIEFVDYEQLEGEADKNGVVKYVALLLKKGWNEPKLISLCTSAELEKVISEKHKAYEGNALYNLIWKPLESFLRDTKEVYYSPSGLIHQIALEAIPYGKGTILSDRYRLIRLSSTRELCNNNNVVNPYASSVVYGGLQYSLSDEDMLSNSQLYSYRSTLTSDDYLSRGGDTATPWRFLPGTRAEAEAVSSLLSSSNISSKLLTGAAGNEESFKSLSGHAPSIIHIATHGFYLQNSDFVSSTTTGNDVRGQLQIQKSALKRSGLIMSGANPAWTEGKLLPNVEDGILTAEEISRLDLRNTLLAIISACDSGLGEINNDGVEGLQRAFKSAGVNTLVVTLWKVDDAATELMMTEFYKNLTKGQSRRTAFDSARAAVRSKFPEPYYWAPFVMID